MVGTEEIRAPTKTTQFLSSLGNYTQERWEIIPNDTIWIFCINRLTFGKRELKGELFPGDSVFLQEQFPNSLFLSGCVNRYTPLLKMRLYIFWPSSFIQTEKLNINHTRFCE